MPSVTVNLFQGPSCGGTLLFQNRRGDSGPAVPVFRQKKEGKKKKGMQPGTLTTLL